MVDCCSCGYLDPSSVCVLYDIPVVDADVSTACAGYAFVSCWRVRVAFKEVEESDVGCNVHYRFSCVAAGPGWLCTLYDCAAGCFLYWTLLRFDALDLCWRRHDAGRVLGSYQENILTPLFSFKVVSLKNKRKPSFSLSYLKPVDLLVLAVWAVSLFVPDPLDFATLGLPVVEGLLGAVYLIVRSHRAKQ